MRMRLTTVFLGLALVFVASPAMAQNTNTRDEIRGSEFVKPVSCVDTRFVDITDRFGKPVGGDPSFPTSGMSVHLKNGIYLIAYSVSQVAVHERSGDKVQLCFLGMVEGTTGCITAADPRGRLYRAYDYRLHAAYTALNSQHVCGGA